MKDSKKTESILHVAKELFSQKGYFNVSTKEIAVKAGVNEVTIFRNFGNKENLYLRVFDFFDDQSETPWGSLDAIQSPVQFLTGVGQQVFGLFRKNISLIRIELKQDMDLDASNMPLAKYSEKVLKYVKDWFTARYQVSEKQLDTMVYLFFSAIFGLFFKTHIAKSPNIHIDIDSCLSMLAESLVDGLKLE